MDSGVIEWLRIYERWEQETDHAKDGEYLRQLAEIAIRHELPIYENGVDDAGAAGWLRLASRGVGAGKSDFDEKGGVGISAHEYQPRPLPWAGKTNTGANK